MTKYFISWLAALLIIFGSVQLSKAARKMQITQISELKDAALSAEPGDTIVIKNGKYEFETVELSVNGEEVNPVVLMPQSKGEVILKGSIFASGKGLVLRDFVFQDVRSEPVVLFQNISYSVVVNNKFLSCGIMTEQGGVVRLKRNASNNIIRNNSFIGCFWTAVKLTHITGSYDNQILNNRFMDLQIKAKGAGCALQINTNANNDTTQLRTLVQGNYFNNYRGQSAEIISVKASKNIISKNLIENSSRADITLRRGYGNTVDNNFVVGSGGIRIYGNSHLIQNNYLIRPKRCGIEFGNGDADSALYSPANAIVALNNFILDPVEQAISFGNNNRGKHAYKHTVVPTNLTISKNVFSKVDGKFFIGLSNNTNIKDSDNIVFYDLDHTDIEQSKLIENAVKMSMNRSDFSTYIYSRTQGEIEKIRANAGCDF